MPAMSSDEIQNVSVSVVEGFLNNKVPMSAGLAKEASERGMNVEQIKRACEASNVISHLKLLQLSDDRTVEFPVCDFSDVMSAMCAPDLSKQAAVAVTTQELIEPLEKQASTEHVFVSSQGDSVQYLIKAAAENKAVLSSIEHDSIVLQDSLIKLAFELRSDQDWNDKLSFVDSDFHAELSSLIGGGAPTEKRDFYGAQVYKQAEVAKYEEVAELFKVAKCMVAEKAKRAELQKRVDGIVKEAMLGAVGNMVGRGMGYMGSKALGGAGMLVKGTGKAIAGTAKGTYNLGMGALAKSKVGKAFNMQPVATSTAGKVVKTTAPVAGAVGLDSYFYRQSGGPGVTQSGASKDVWDALQG